MTDTQKTQRKHTKNNDSQSKPQIGDSLPAPKRPAKARTKAKNKPVNSVEQRPQKQRPQKQKKRLKAKKPQKSASSNKPRKTGRQNKQVGRYQMLVHKDGLFTHTAIMQGLELTEYSISSEDYSDNEIYGNIYMGQVESIYPGTEMAFINIGTSKNAVLHQGDLMPEMEDYEEPKANGQSSTLQIELALRPKQHVLCQVVKNPIAHKGGRLTQEISLPGRYLIFKPNRGSFGISRSIDVSDSDKKRFSRIIKSILPKGHGVIVRTSAKEATEEEITEDLNSLMDQWGSIEQLSKRSGAPALLYRGADTTFRAVRDKFNTDFRGISIDNLEFYEKVSTYIKSVAPSLIDRVYYHDSEVRKLSLFEEHHVYEQLSKALNKTVWLPSGGSILIESTEALTAVDVNTAKSTSSLGLEDTVLNTNLEAAVEVAKQLRLRDIGGIIVIDFIDMQESKSKERLTQELRRALAQDPTRTQIENISSFGLVEMTRKRIGEGLMVSFSDLCDDCGGIGRIVDKSLLSSVAVPSKTQKKK